jgi:Tfp pilus assembly protein PilF
MVLWTSTIERRAIFRSAAGSEPDLKSCEDLLIAASMAYANSDDQARAERTLHAAAKLDPTYYRPYSILATTVYASRKDLRFFADTAAKSGPFGAV